jgi:hypothetical protein
MEVLEAMEVMEATQVTVLTVARLLLAGLQEEVAMLWFQHETRNCSCWSSAT